MFHNEKFELTKIERSQFKNDKLYYTKIYRMKQNKIKKCKDATTDTDTAKVLQNYFN